MWGDTRLEPGCLTFQGSLTCKRPSASVNAKTRSVRHEAVTWWPNEPLKVTCISPGEKAGRFIKNTSWHIMATESKYVEVLKHLFPFCGRILVDAHTGLLASSPLDHGHRSTPGTAVSRWDDGFVPSVDGRGDSLVRLNRKRKW